VVEGNAPRKTAGYEKLEGHFLRNPRNPRVPKGIIVVVKGGRGRFCKKGEKIEPDHCKQELRGEMRIKAQGGKKSDSAQAGKALGGR